MPGTNGLSDPVGVSAELMAMEKVNRVGGFSDPSSDPDVY